jgi:hypothetical protein
MILLYKLEPPQLQSHSWVAPYFIAFDAASARGGHMQGYIRTMSSEINLTN